MDGIIAHPKTKQEAKLIVELFDKMNISYEKIIKTPKAKVIPHILNVPNAVTRHAINEAREGKGKKFTSLNRVFEELKR